MFAINLIGLEEVQRSKFMFLCFQDILYQPFNDFSFPLIFYWPLTLYYLQRFPVIYHKTFIMVETLVSVFY